MLPSEAPVAIGVTSSAIAGWLRAGLPWLVSLAISFGYVLRRSARITSDGRPRLQAPLTCAGLSCAD